MNKPAKLESFATLVARIAKEFGVVRLSSDEKEMFRELIELRRQASKFPRESTEDKKILSEV